jgi:hypothetical protein
MAGTSPAMTREKWINVTGIRSQENRYMPLAGRPLKLP